VRQRALFERGEIPVQENRGYDEDQDLTISQRSKEEAHDYRYFPEPDIPPMHFDADYIEDLKKKLPELPSARKTRLMNDYGLSLRTASMLSEGGEIELYKKFIELTKKGLNPVEVSNALINKIEFKQMSVDEIVKRFEETKLKVVDSVEIEDFVKKVLENNPEAIASYKSGKTTVIEFLVGQVMRETKGRVDSSIVRELFKKFLV
jgi:aspartyl-tRNA(Asn)/glutamyl-tRNA(Gln) amidotransferase subunit B